MKFHGILWSIVFCASAAVAGYINEPPSIPPGDLYMAGSTPDQAEDSGVLAASVSVGLTSHGDSDYILVATDRVLQVSAPLTAERTWTLPCADAMPAAGQAIQIIDALGNVSPKSPLKIVPQSGCTTANTLNGASTNIATLNGHEWRALAITDQVSNWSVVVLRQPERTLDFVQDFGGRSATAIGTTDCTMTIASTTVTCSHTHITTADIGDQFEAQAADIGGNTLITTVATVNPAAHQLTLASAPHFATQSVKVIDRLFVDLAHGANLGSGYSLGSVQTLPTGTGSDTPATGTPKLLTVVAVQPHSGSTGSGCTNGTVTLTLSPNGQPNGLAGVQAQFTGTISGGTLTSIGSIVSGSAYRAIGPYTYDSSGWYESVPAAPPTPCIISPKVDIKFGVLTEAITNSPNVYSSGTIPCDNSHATPATITSSDVGVGLQVTCSSHKPLVSFGQDNVGAIEAVNDYETAQIAAHQPVCVKFSGRFLSRTVGAAHPIVGGPCLEGDAQILSGIFIFPADADHPRGDIFPIVDANGNGSTGPAQSQVITDDPTGKPVLAGTYITNLSFWGDWTSSHVQNAIKFYGFTQWVTMMNVSSWNLRGCLLCVGVDSDNHGQIAESTFFNLRTEFTGDSASATPAIGLDGIGYQTNSPNNDLILRYRTYDDNGVPLAIRPCTDTGGAGTGFGAHELTISELKVEESNMEYSTNATDGVQVGATTPECESLVWTKLSEGEYSDFTESTMTAESGVHNLTFLAPNIVNPAVGTAAFRFKGCTSADLLNMRIIGGAVSSTPSENGLGLKFDVGGGGNLVDLVSNNTTDYNLIYSGTFDNADCSNSANVLSGALEYNAHDRATTAFIDGGINVMTTLRCVLGSILGGCDGANGQLVDAASSQTISNKILSAPTIQLSSLLISPVAPTITSGFGTSASITANGTASFQITIGTGGASSGTVGLPTAAHGWDCKATDVTTQTTVVFLTKQTGSSTNSATLKNFSVTGANTSWAAGDLLNVNCQAF